MENLKFELNNIFNHRDEGSLSFNLSKKQAALLLVSFDGAKTDHNRKYITLPTSEKYSKKQEAIVRTEATAVQLKGQASEPVMSFNLRFIEEAFKFIMCSDARCIEIHYSENLNALILKSGRLYAMVLPVKLRDDVA